MILTPYEGTAGGKFAPPPCLAAWFQPQWSLHSGALVGYEALARVRGAVADGEPAGLLRDMDALAWPARESAHRALLEFMARAAVRAALASGVRVAVNVPAFLLENGAAVEIMAGAGDALCAEILETYAIAHPRAARSAITTLRAAGVHVAVDDFGTGHASKNLLRSVPDVDIVKVDASVLARAQSDGGRYLRGLCRRLHAYGAVVVAEGIECSAQHDIAAAAGADVEQGYWCGRPVEQPSYRVAPPAAGVEKPVAA